MRRTHKVPTYWGGYATVTDFNNNLDSLEPNIEIYVRLARKCSAVATEQRGEWKDWADRALALGITDVLLHGTLRDRMESEQYEQLMHDFWEAGEPTALFTLANIYRRAAYVASDPFGHIRAYAHDAAVLALMRDHYESTGVGLDETGLSGFEDHLAMQRQHMHAHEIDEAEQLAMDIIEKNDNCCLAWPGYLTDF